MLGNGFMLPQHKQLSPLVLVAQAASALPAPSLADPHVLLSHTAGADSLNTVQLSVRDSCLHWHLVETVGEGLTAPARRAAEEWRRNWTAVKVLESGFSIMWGLIFTSGALRSITKHRSYF